MSERGVFAVDRGVWDHPLLAEDAAFSRREAWMWLISEAAWKARRIYRSGKLVELERGQLAHSLRHLAKEWSWSVKKVRTFLGALKKDTMIDTQTDTAVTVITICKYDEYQKVSLPKGTASDTAEGTRRAQQGHNNKSIKHKEYSVPNGTGGKPPDSLALIRKQLWDEGKKLLREADGISDSTAGGKLAKLVQASGDNLTLVLSKVRDCNAAQPPPMDPFTWIMGRVSTKKAEAELAKATETDANVKRKLDEVFDGDEGRTEGVH